MNVMGNLLTSCSQDGHALTGYTRTGKCESHESDRGNHHICMELPLMDGTNFCKQTNQANWCEEERPCHDHGGLCRIDFWCVCEWAFSDIVEKVGCEKVNVDCSATSMKAFEHYGTDRKHAHALECLKQKCLLHSISEKVERGMKNVDKNIDVPR